MTGEREGLAEEIARVLGEHEGCRANDSRDGHYISSCDTGVDVWTCGITVPYEDDYDAMGRAHLADALADLLAARDRRVRAEAWDEAAELADTQIVLWSEVPGLHPEAKEPHPAAIAASGARRSLVVLRSRMAEAFTDRADRIEAP